ncbi:ParB N-terminal domain-containing protein [Tianweitania sediminis]|uniref:ParB N-terminal domain-containing protein n=1 Tax=Tianweitania sediminis TaxID=1502156 RepID=A0A8J7UIZ9_9HYPH|nr:ParB N-terminal domain-containing protein [Tianweitania sediminis]MBP0439473.1 ParB N-terminal domain-containing protein [Tianweitania sediminis]
MVQVKQIAISDIVVPERLRAVEEEHALAIAQSIVEHGLINPVTVRATPAAKGGSYTLVAGAHRLRAFEINEESLIEAVIVEADKAEAQLIEVVENLFRNDLSVMDRATFVGTYRQVWEGKYGKIEAGRPGNRANLAQLLEEEAEAGGFAQHVADRMGVSSRSIKRLNLIAQHLHPEVRSAVRGTAIADNQSALLKLAKMEPAKQRRMAIAFKSEGPDLSKAMVLVEGARPKINAQDAAFSSLMDAWARANAATRARFLTEIKAAPNEADGAGS